MFTSEAKSLISDKKQVKVKLLISKRF